eukprot:5697998-Prymnesium_polylepis.1
MDSNHQSNGPSAGVVSDSQGVNPGGVLGHNSVFSWPVPAIDLPPPRRQLGSNDGQAERGGWVCVCVKRGNRVAPLTACSLAAAGGDLQGGHRM